MVLPKLTDNLDIHQSLPDQPTETAEELKRLFDEGSNRIKKYINNLLLSGIENGVATDLAKVKKDCEDKITDELNKFRTEMNELINGKIGDINSNFNSFKSSMESLINTTISNMNNTLNGVVSNLSTTVYGNLSTKNNTSLIWAEISKNCNRVHLFVHARCSISANTEQDVLQLPDGFKPGVTKICASFQERSGGFNFSSRATIESNGNVKINGGSTGTDTFMIEAVFEV